MEVMSASRPSSISATRITTSASQEERGMGGADDDGAEDDGAEVGAVAEGGAEAGGALAAVSERGADVMRAPGDEVGATRRRTVFNARRTVFG
jgi:hypothetical protein